MDRTLTYREALRAFADGKTIETKHCGKWCAVKSLFQVTQRALDSPSPYRIRQAAIDINGVEVPEPERMPLNNGTLYWFPYLEAPHDPTPSRWDGDQTDAKRLRLGIVHLTPEAAEAHARGLILASGGQV